MLATSRSLASLRKRVPDRLAEGPGELGGGPNEGFGEESAYRPATEKPRFAGLFHIEDVLRASPVHHTGGIDPVRCASASLNSSQLMKLAALGP
jgi:hypothetical protein